MGIMVILASSADTGALTRATATGTAAPSDECAVCGSDAAALAIYYADWFLLAAVTLATLTATAAIYERIMAARRSSGAGGVDSYQSDAVADTISPILQALSGLIDALAKAPAWFAIFLSGFALLWLASDLAKPAEEPDPDDKNTATKKSVATGTITGTITGTLTGTLTPAPTGTPTAAASPNAGSGAATNAR